MCSLLNQKQPDYLQDKTLEEFEEMVFKQLDTDSDGFITKEEFVKELSERRDVNCLAGLLTYRPPNTGSAPPPTGSDPAPTGSS